MTATDEMIAPRGRHHAVHSPMVVVDPTDQHKPKHGKLIMPVYEVVVSGDGVSLVSDWGGTIPLPRTAPAESDDYLDGERAEAYADGSPDGYTDPYEDYPDGYHDGAGPDYEPGAYQDNGDPMSGYFDDQSYGYAPPRIRHRPIFGRHRGIRRLLPIGGCVLIGLVAIGAFALLIYFANNTHP